MPNGLLVYIKQSGPSLPIKGWIRAGAKKFHYELKILNLKSLDWLWNREPGKELLKYKFTLMGTMDKTRVTREALNIIGGSILAIVVDVISNGLRVTRAIENGLVQEYLNKSVFNILQGI